MSSEVIIQKRFVPKVGEGKNLRVALRDMSAALVANGFPEMEIWAPIHGGHNVLVTVERYAVAGRVGRVQRDGDALPGARLRRVRRHLPHDDRALRHRDPAARRQVGDPLTWPPRSSPSWAWAPRPPPPGRGRTPRSPTAGTRSATEVHDLAADGRRVAVIEGAIWPAVGRAHHGPRGRRPRPDGHGRARGAGAGLPSAGQGGDLRGAHPGARLRRPAVDAPDPGQARSSGRP